MKTAEIRESFLGYFESKEHHRVPSSPLIPHDDPTLLFINAGMNQFKDVFLGQRKLPYKRATSSQKCMRAGGKHNDLENVGKTARHHTFFEMLGNFSFGDYFKEEAIYFCWDYIRNVINLPADRLYTTVYNNDDEAFALWEKIAPELKNGRIMRFDEKDNFWSMGDTGPCGPSSEIHYDRGKQYSCGRPDCDVNCEYCDRYMELGNLVFMQFDRDTEGNLTPLPKPSVDTGSGLERIAMVMQGVESNYDTDLFVPLLKAIEGITSREYFQDKRGVSHRVIADHVRALTFTIADGAIPANEGRGYVLRRILRRASRHGRLLGAEEPFIYRLTSTLVDVMGDVYPEIRKQADHVALVIKSEEESFGQTLDRGIELFEKVAAKVKSANGTVIPGAEVFKLYDTFGFPVDLTEVMAREQGMTLDMARFESELLYQRERSKSLASFSPLPAKNYPPSEFTGYDDKFEAESEVISYAPYHGREAEWDETVLDQTPFYGESGGQVGDKGKLIIEGREFTVIDTRRVGDSVVHLVRRQVDFEPTLKRKRVKIKAIVDGKRQKHIQRNHTATHLLHRALRDVLGEHVQQAGSLVDPDRLRFDFSHFKQVTSGELKDIEHRVNEQILLNRKVKWQMLSLEEAKKQGAVALFGEKYDEKVRMVEVEGYSKELCGGTHVQATGEIGAFVIVSESAIAAGMRRIEAMTGDGAMTYLDDKRRDFDQLVHTLKLEPDKVVGRIEELLEENKHLKKELDKSRADSAVSNLSELFENKSKTISGVKVLIYQFESRDELNAYADYTQTIKDPACGVFYSDKNQYAVTASGAAIKMGLSARNLINHLNQALDGRGGGREYFTQGGTSMKINESILAKTVYPFIKEKAKG